MAGKSTTFFWSLFSAGGTIAAFLFPVHIFLIGLAFPLGWMKAPGYESLAELFRHPLTRLYLIIFIAFPLFHWAHRFCYTLYDAFQLKHLNQLIAILCYGSALVGTVVAAFTLWTVP